MSTNESKIIDITVDDLSKVTLTSSQPVPIGMIIGTTTEVVSPVSTQTSTQSTTPSIYEIVLQNSQTDATPSPFQTLLQLDLSSVISSASVSDLLSLLFCQDEECESPLYAWIESYSSDLSSVYVWVLLPNGISASSSTTIYMKVTNTNQYPYTGIAPQLTATYAEYDNGSQIFPYYQRWGGLSSLPSGWDTESESIVNFYPTYTQFSPNPDSSYYTEVYLTTSDFDGPIAWDFYGNMYSNGSDLNWVDADTDSDGEYGYGFVEGYSPSNLIYLSNGADFTTYDTGYDDTDSDKVYTLYYDGSYINALINYNSIFSADNAATQTIFYFVFYSGISDSSLTVTPITVYWLRTRALPPNGVMPTMTSFTKIS